MSKIVQLNAKTKAGLSGALGIPENYLDAVCRGVSVARVIALKICPYCWKPGTEAEPIWLELRSKYCFLCGTVLRDRCEAHIAYSGNNVLKNALVS